MNTLKEKMGNIRPEADESAENPNEKSLWKFLSRII